MNEYKYYIKTQEEFIRDFGENYIGETYWADSNNMDYLFGQEIPEKAYNIIIEAGNQGYNLSEIELKHLISKDQGRDWYIDHQMVTKKLVLSPKEENILASRLKGFLNEIL